MSAEQKLNFQKFPERLREIPDPPPHLYVQGILPDFESSSWIAVVGARKYTDYGKTACEQIIAGLRGTNVVIVSGLALGIDAIAHRAALSAHIPTVAIPGSGLDPRVLYPATNRGLAQDILTQGGALVSEFETMHRPRPEDFPKRNRIMAGVSHAVLVIEATERSGTLITARLALDYNRDVLAVPGSIFSRNSEGVHKLLRTGAAPITCAEDILTTLNIEIPTGVYKKNHMATYKIPTDCSPHECQILEILCIEPLPRDDVVERLNLPVHSANIAFSTLEIKGYITEKMGLIHRL